ncbi:sulfurtransferase [Alkalilimnicola ehrlichii]|uniref:Sulfurtransferase n=1 Tax=Alkalilimnicola ehrlichii TaxID=351052 RepID=A0A3E0WZ31_9GAMM|nr:rhodanese-like domain-containing protein [Alkalilimnicola ehrlichii]RFA30079.1 sulfurtransferase [Alkalilimnicola ehrlichii]RFA37423.1 sulfurtransferase [Alkalilimnicola ehrlichii]
MKELLAIELQQWLAEEERKPVVLDVREHWEYDVAHLPGSTHIPMGEIPSRFTELSPDVPLVVLCHHGVRSAQVAHYLEHQGFDTVYNLVGGIDAWSHTVDPTVPTY